MSVGCYTISSLVFLSAMSLTLSQIRQIRKELKCETTKNSCETLLREEIKDEPIPTQCSNAEQIFSHYSIDSMQTLQPSVTLSNFTNLPKINTGRGLVVGYRDCNNHPSTVCYLVVRTLPYEGTSYNSWYLSPEGQRRHLTPGDTCTFFGCFLYKESETEPETCFKNEIYKENITILGKCSEYNRDSVEDGNVTSKFLPEYPNQYVAGTVVSISCDEGYVASYNGTSVCQSNGNWSTPEFPTCIRGCPSVNMDIKNGVAVTSNSIPIVNTTITITCHQYYNGSGTITCGEDGNWSSSLPSCYPLMCSVFEDSVYGGSQTPHRPEGAPIVVDGYPINTTITVSCDIFHQGGGQIACTDSGTWSHQNLPICSADTRIIVVFIVTPLTLSAVIIVLLSLCRKCMTVRKDRVRRMGMILFEKTIKEPLDPDYTPVDVNPQMRNSSSTDDYFFSTINSSFFLFTDYAQPLAKSSSVTDLQHEQKTSSSTDKNKSCPALQALLIIEENKPSPFTMLDVNISPDQSANTQN